MTPTVSVVIAAYNAEQFIAQAIQSVLDQTFSDLEIVVVDDGSTDSTAARALACDDGRVRLLQSKNRGAAAARNMGIEATNSPWIAILDADDFWGPQRLEGLLDTAIKEQADLVCDDLVWLDEREPTKTFFENIGLKLDKPTRLDPAEVIPGNLAGRAWVPVGLLKPVIRREFLLATGVRYGEDLRVFEDHLLLSQCVLRGARALLVPSRTYFYRVLPVSLSKGDWIIVLENRLRYIDRIASDALLPAHLRPVLTRWRKKTVLELDSRRCIDAIAARNWRSAYGQIERRPAVLLLLAREVISLARVRAALRSRVSRSLTRIGR